MQAKQEMALQEMALLVAEQSAENAKTVKQGNPGFQSRMSGPFSRCKAWGATVFRDSSWRLAQPRRMFRKSARLWHRLCGHWRQESRILNLAPRRTASRAKWWARTKGYPRYPVAAKWTPKDKKPSRGVCQTPSQQRGDRRRNANRKEKVCGLLRLWIWNQIIAVVFNLSLSRIGEADNPGLVQAIAKLFGVQFEAIGQWAANLTSKSEMELAPLLAQVGQCRQMVSESFEKESHPYTSSVSQNIQGTHSHTGSLPLPVSTEPGGDSAHTQQFSDYLSLSQVGNECDESRRVSAQMQICDRNDALRDNPFCHRSQKSKAH